MISRSGLVSALCVVAAAAALNGCGSDSGVTTTGQSGRLTQGPVVNAIVFADRVSAGTRFVEDGGEVRTVTDATTGDFVLPTVPGYNYILVSKGGTDKLTGAAAIQMIAPAGAANITPLTTLVALDTTGTVKAKLEALMPAGAKFDADISTTSSTAVLLVAKSVETMVAAMTKSVTDVAGAGTISAGQQTAVQMETLKAISQQLGQAGVTATTLQTPALLSTALSTAAAVAATDIQTNNANITLPAATAQTIATSAVTGIVTALGVNANAAAATTALNGGEAAVITPATKDSFVAATTNAVTTTGIVAVVTPPNYTPPVIPVVTPITVPGTTGATGGTTGGTGTTF